MNFLENIALPQSAHHIELLYGLLILTFILFIPYLALVNGALFYSLYFNRKGNKTGEDKYFSIAKRIIDLVTFNKSMSFAVGVIPLLSIIFSYAQLLQGTNSGVPEYLLFALISLLLSLISLYTFKYSFHLKGLLDNLTNEDLEAEKYKAGVQTLFNKTGRYSLLFTILTAWIFIGAVTMARQASLWDNNFIELLFSLKSIVNLFGFFFLSIFITSVVSFYVYFKPNSEFVLGEEESNLLKSVSLKGALTSLVILPAFILFDLLLTSSEALNGNLFVFSLFAVIALIFIGNFVYLMIKNESTDYVTSVLFLSLIFIIFMVVKDQSAFETSTKYQYVQLASSFENYKVDLQKQYGAFKEAAISGEDIFNGRCVACHSFDKKVVGPAYNTVLGKYDGKIDQLVNFIMNPVKINPDFPNMPNQGLKPNEAKAVAEYILSVYKQNNP